MMIPNVYKFQFYLHLIIDPSACIVLWFGFNLAFFGKHSQRFSVLVFVFVERISLKVRNKKKEHEKERNESYIHRSRQSRHFKIFKKLLRN